MEGLKLSKYRQVEASSKKYGEINDCVVCAIAMAYDIDYELSHEICAKSGRIAGRPCHTMRAVYKATSILGIPHKLMSIPKQSNGSRYTVKTIANYLPIGNYIVRVDGHALPLIDGHIYDDTNGRKHRIIEVYRIGSDLLEIL